MLNKKREPSLGEFIVDLIEVAVLCIVYVVFAILAIPVQLLRRLARR